MAMAVQPVVKLLNHRIGPAIGAKLVSVFGMTLETGLVGCFLNDGSFFHPQNQSRFDADFGLSTDWPEFGDNQRSVQ